MKIPTPDELGLRGPDQLTFAELFAVKAATGVDLYSGSTITEQLPALVWFHLPEEGRPSWPDFVHEIKGSDLVDHSRRLFELDNEQSDATAAAAQERDDRNAVAEQVAATRDPDQPTPAPAEPATDPFGPSV